VVDAARRRGALALRVLVSAALLAAVLLYADVGDVLAALRDGQWEWFAVALAVMAVCLVLGALRWWLLLEGAGIHIAARDSIRPYAVSFVLNILLPTAVAGDAVRTWVIGRQSGRLLGAAAATVVDRLTALACLFVVGWVAYAVDRSAVPESVLVAFAWVTAGLAVALALGVMAAVGVRPLVHRLPERVANVIRESWGIVRSWASTGQLVVRVVALGLAYQVLVVTVFVLAAKIVGVELSFALAAVSTPIVVLAPLIPVSVGGLGIREGGFVILLGQAGIGAADATVVSLLSAATVVIASAGVAGVTYLFGSVGAEPGVVPPRRSA
jgi:glycosyltransferase 2 family protein